VTALLDHVRHGDAALYSFVRLAVSSGARRSQLLALRWADFTPGLHAVRFTRAVRASPNGPVFGPTKTGRTDNVELDEHTAAAIAEHRRSCSARAAAHGAVLDDDSFVFASDVEGRSPWLPNHTTKRFIAARRAAGLPSFRLHDLRHFMATQMLAAGVPVVVSQRLSHARPSTTLNFYAHAIPGGDRAAADRLAAILSTSGP
jgi:integrase